jgi:hypothetical protein
MAFARDINALTIERPSGVKRAGQHSVYCGSSNRSRNWFDLRINVFVLFRKSFLGRPFAASGGNGKALIVGPFHKARDGPLLGRQFKYAFDYRSSRRVKRLMLRRAEIEIPNAGLVCANAAISQFPGGVPDFLGRHPGVVLREHSVDVHVERAGAGVFILGIDKSNIDAPFYEFSHYGIVTPVPADPIPAKDNDSLEQTLAQKPNEPLEFRPIDPVLDYAVICNRQFVVLFEARMPLGNHPVEAKSGEREMSDL